MHNVMNAVDVRGEKALHPLLLKQKTAYRRITLDLKPFIRHLISL